MAMYYCGRRTWHVSPATRYLTGPRGGICLTPQAAKEEIDGTDHPVEVFTPASWGEDNTESSEGTDSTETTGEGGAS